LAAASINPLADVGDEHDRFFQDVNELVFESMPMSLTKARCPGPTPTD
jgi:hypothetical protein